MTMRLQLIIALITLGWLGYLIRLVRRNVIELRYAFGWMLLSVCVLVLDICPGILYFLARLCGIELPSNMIFLVAIFLLLSLSFSQMISISRLSRNNTRIIQEVALLNKQMEKYVDSENSR